MKTPIIIIALAFLIASASAREELTMAGCDPPYRVILQYDNETFCCIDLDKNDQCDYPVITYQDANNKTVIRYDPVINKTPLPGMILQPATTSTLFITTTTIRITPTTIRSTTPTTLHISTPTTIDVQTTSSTLQTTQQTVSPPTTQITPTTIQTTLSTTQITPSTMYNVRPMPTTTTSPDITKTITNTIASKDPSGTYTIIAIAFFIIVVIATVLYTLGSEKD
jgi:hypothetical protein